VTEIKAERVVCLTATATPRVAKDICDAFHIEETGLFRTSTYRPNLRLLAETATTKQELYPKLFAFLRSNPGASIVYVALQRHTEALAKDLRDQGFNAEAFHAGLKIDVKTNLQNEFMRCENMIIVATIAFGMGIDKTSIRTVVHFNIPSSIESYSQEIGRAGRDGKNSICMFYVCAEDLHLREIFARGDLPSRESVNGLLQDIFDPVTMRLPIGAEIKSFQVQQGKDFDIRATTLNNIYTQLELKHGLIRATTPTYTKYTFKPASSFSTRLASDTSPAAQAIKLTAKHAILLTHIDVDIAANKVRLSRLDIRKLNDWNEEGMIELKPSGVLNVYKILSPLPQTPASISKIANDIYSAMQKREQEALDRTDAILNLITSPMCFNRSLAKYFGDDLPTGKVECGHCTWCESHERVQKPIPPKVEFNWPAFRTVLLQVRARDDARFLARVAFGISSPRVSALKLGRHPVFGSMGDHEFMVSRFSAMTISLVIQCVTGLTFV
jgi:hypothetical protein